MARSESGGDQLTAQESWRTIHESMDRARSSMYIAGSAPILLWWAAIASVGVATQYAIMTLAPDFIENNSWVFGALWGSLMVPGMTGSAFIGHRAGRKVALGDASRSAGIKVFLYWMTVVVAMFLIPLAAGMWNGEDGDQIPMVTMGIVSLAYILFGIMNHTVIAIVGVAFAAAFFIPNALLGDVAMPVSGGLMLAVVAAGAWWMRRNGVS